jgi:hypothetical protein
MYIYRCIIHKHIFIKLYIFNTFIFYISPLTIKVPRKTRYNGTLFLHVILSPTSSNQFRQFKQLVNVSKKL